MKVKNAKPCESFYQEINTETNLVVGHQLPYFISHTFSSEGERQETQTPELCSSSRCCSTSSVTQFNPRIVPARSRCQKLMANTAKPLIKITTLVLFPLKLDATISHPHPPQTAVHLVEYSKIQGVSNPTSKFSVLHQPTKVSTQQSHRNAALGQVKVKPILSIFP